MNLMSVSIALFGSVGVLLIFSHLFSRKVSMAQAIAPYLGVPLNPQISSNRILRKIKNLLVSGDSAIWASDKRLAIELRKCSSQQTVSSFRLEQLIFACLDLLLVAIWIFLRLGTGHQMNPLTGLLLLVFAFVLGGSFRSWLLKETSRKRIKKIDAQLPALLDLLAFSVSAGEPILASMQRVTQTCTGELTKEIQRITNELSLGENFLVSLERNQKELGSQSLARSFRAIIMAMERGTPIADVLRAQAMDARNHEARRLMTLAGKKETLMMIPVVFLILPMIVIVALYPGLMALQNF